MSEARARRGLAVLLALAVLAAYAGVARAGFVSYDDPPYVSANPIVARGLTAAGVRWAFGAFHASNWHPLTWLSHMLDVELFGLDPGRHHLVSVAWHALGSALCLLALRRLGVGLAAAAGTALLFALHPLHVESVAWIAERKDVLSGAFFFLCLWLYAGHARAPRGRVPWAAAGCFALGLLAKPMLVTLPVVLLLVDRWPLARTRTTSARALVLEKAPFLALALASTAVTLLAQGAGGAIQPFERLPLDARLAHAPVAVLGYLRRFVWPSGLACYYPHPLLVEGAAGSPWSAGALGAAGAVAALTLVAFAARRRAPAVWIGWLWTLVMLLPVLGIVQVGGQALADRYFYLPSVGLSLALVVPLSARLPARATWAGLSALALALGLASARQAATWRDTITLFRRALAVTGENAVAATNLGSALAEDGRLEEAEPVLARAMALAPGDPRPAVSYASVRALRGDLAGAREAFAQAARRAPGFAPALTGLARASAALGQDVAAREAWEALLCVAPDDARAHHELGALLDGQGERAAALAQYRAALRCDPDLAEAGLALSWLVSTTPATPAERAEALACARRAAARQGDADALDVLAAALAASGDGAGASAAGERALALGGAQGRAERESRLARYRAGGSLVPGGADQASGGEGAR